MYKASIGKSAGTEKGYFCRSLNNLKTMKKVAVDEAIDWAIEKNLLKGFFAEQQAEVTAMCLTEFDQELYDKNRRREGYEEGKLDGAHENAVENAKNFLRMNILSHEQIAQGTDLPLEEVQKLAEEIK